MTQLFGLKKYLNFGTANNMVKQYFKTTPESKKMEYDSIFVLLRCDVEHCKSQEKIVTI